MKVLLEQCFSVLTTLTYFEIREPCEAQNRGARPWLAPVAWLVDSLTPSGGKLDIAYTL